MTTNINIIWIIERVVVANHQYINLNIYLRVVWQDSSTGVEAVLQEPQFVTCPKWLRLYFSLKNGFSGKTFGRAPPKDWRSQS